MGSCSPDPIVHEVAREDDVKTRSVPGLQASIAPDLKFLRFNNMTWSQRAAMRTAWIRRLGMLLRDSPAAWRAAFRNGRDLLTR